MFGRAKVGATPRLIPAEEVKKGNDTITGTHNATFEPKMMVHDEGDRGYAVYLGLIEGALKCGIRFNGEGDQNTDPKNKYVGFPYVPGGGQGAGIDARWFILPEWLTAPILEAALLERKRKGLPTHKH